MGEETDADVLRARVLVIDDEPVLLKMLCRTLATEHEVVSSSSAKEALARIAAGERFDLVLCDLTLPGMTGIDLHQALGKVAPEVEDRIVFMTGGACTLRAEAFLARPDIRHVAKPFASIAALRALVREYLRRVRG